MNISILKPESIVNEVFALYEKYGKRKPTDQELSELEQVSQAAALAEEEGYEDEVILAAFFHNAGEILGADYLREHGFSERLATLVDSDLRATRYLAYKYTEYYDHLSESEKADLEARGGKMSREEADKFELDPDAELFVHLRYLNDKAKKTRKYKLNIPHIKLLAMSHLYKIMDKYVPAFLGSKSSIQPKIG